MCGGGGVFVCLFVFPRLFKFKTCWIHLVPCGGDVTITGHFHSQVNKTVFYSAGSDKVSSCASSVAMPEWEILSVYRNIVCSDLEIH